MNYLLWCCSLSMCEPGILLEFFSVKLHCKKHIRTTCWPQQTCYMLNDHGSERGKKLERGSRLEWACCRSHSLYQCEGWRTTPTSLSIMPINWLGVSWRDLIWYTSNENHSISGRLAWRAYSTIFVGWV